MSTSPRYMIDITGLDPLSSWGGGNLKFFRINEVFLTYERVIGSQ